MANRCFAYNLDGSRCERQGGHEGDHQVTTIWEDEESWDPNAPVEEPEEYVDVETDQPFLVQPLSPEEFDLEAIAALAPDEEVIIGMCFVCSHTWHEEHCEVSGCGCLTAVA